GGSHDRSPGRPCSSDSSSSSLRSRRRGRSRRSRWPTRRSTSRRPRRRCSVSDETTHTQGKGWYSRFERFESILLFAGVGSLLVSFIGLGLLPALEIDDQIQKTTPESYQAMTAE